MRVSISTAALRHIRFSGQAGLTKARSLRWLTTATIDRGAVHVESDELHLNDLVKRSFSYDDVLSSSPSMVLKAALKNFLPIEPYKHYDGQPHHFLMGHQYAYFRPDLSAEMLCHDGTDVKFVPGPESIWRYRLWAGGSVHFLKRFPIGITSTTRQTVSVEERVKDVRVVAKEGRATKVFVAIQRTFGSFKNPIPELARKAMLLDNEGAHPDFPLMSETQKLCFLREPPTSMQDGRRISPPSNPTFTHTMTPSAHLLFQFSALTHNAHRIHIDRDFAREDYGAKDLLVHGPLTQVLMIEFLYRHLRSLRPESDYTTIPRKMDYTNLQPLFVDEPLTLCCKPVVKRADEEDEQPPGHWQVWIQKGEGDNVSCAVKATIDVEYLKRPDYLCEPSGSENDLVASEANTHTSNNETVNDSTNGTKDIPP